MGLRHDGTAHMEFLQDLHLANVLDDFLATPIDPALTMRRSHCFHSSAGP